MPTDPALCARSMAEVLATRAELAPEKLAVRFLIDGEEEGPQLSYAELDRAARAVAVALRDITGPGERALLLYAPGLEFLSAFFGCLYAGMVAVPAYPPRLDRMAQSLQALDRIALDCTPRVVLTGGVVAGLVHGCLQGALAEVPCLVTDGIDAARATAWRPASFVDHDVALLQYTSGSTAAPKGVMVTHSNLMHNERMIQGALEHSGHGVGVCWLPPYHDMGLIGGILQVVFHGASSMLMSPITLLQDPFRWLRAIARYRADTVAGPNLAYDLCVDRITPEQRALLDLSNLSVAAIGSEPIRPETMARFSEAFAPCGFRPETFYPCYGLAEATLLVTGGAKSARPVIRSFVAAELDLGRVVSAEAGAGARKVVGCGHAWLDQEVAIVDPDTAHPCASGTVGEIWVKGPSVAAGYWNRPEETRHTFAAHLDDTGRGPFLRTGDLGFIQDDELFLTGRLKDLIVIRGKNHNPEDIEETVQGVHPSLRRGCGAAFEVEHHGVPTLVLVQEVERRCRQLDVARLLGDIREAVVRRHELQVRDVALLEHGSIPKTSSGKVQRHRCRLSYQQGTLRRWRGKDA